MRFWGLLSREEPGLHWSSCCW